ncbi:unnamed protein product [Mytilus coruscus]|uniref:Uncharacterized protein n=1 Tax=Mytilus coruscus TaxID=42192 RepID=A0A6J8ACJ8_MYTCO|nr:unnamed protein product [Mytilus coruscus]
MFLNSVSSMLQNIRAERNGISPLHLSSIRAMLPLFFVTNRNNYSRWTPVYHLDMLNLHAEVEARFNNEFFAMFQKAGSFNGVWSHMATEKSIIKYSKGNGGIVGLTRKKSALIRCNVTRHIVGHFSVAMKMRSGLVTADDNTHDESRPPSMKRDEQQVIDLISHLQETMVNPFDIQHHPSELVNISTGLKASKEVQESLLNAIDTCTAMIKKFFDSALSAGMSRSFYGPIQRSNIKTFSDMNKKTKLKCRSGETVQGNINPELIFCRALALTKCRDDVPVEKLLSFPIGPISTSLFHDDGTMRK